MMRSCIPDQTASSEQSPFPKASKKCKAFETVVCPSASMEAKGVIPEGREASSDHCLHTERVHRRRHTFSVSPRYRFHQELDHWRVAHRHDSHHGLCDYVTNSSARNDRASDR